MSSEQTSGPDTPSEGREPEGFGDAVQAAAIMLGLMTSLAWVGFQWQRRYEQGAHRFAIDLVERVARHGDRALMPVWSGLGRGPMSESAQNTFRALRGLGRFGPDETGRCRIASRFALCQGTRYQCDVSGSTPAGPVTAAIGLCSHGKGMPYTFDAFDLTLPAVDADQGNRENVDVERDGKIRYGVTPLPPDAPGRLIRQTPRMPVL